MLYRAPQKTFAQVKIVRKNEMKPMMMLAREIGDMLDIPFLSGLLVGSFRTAMEGGRDRGGLGRRRR